MIHLTNHTQIHIYSDKCVWWLHSKVLVGNEKGKEMVKLKHATIEKGNAERDTHTAPGS